MKKLSNALSVLFMSLTLGVILFAAFGSATSMFAGVAIGLTAPLISSVVSMPNMAFNSLVWIGEDGKFKSIGEDELLKLDEKGLVDYHKAKEKDTQDKLDTLFGLYNKAKTDGEETSNIIGDIKSAQKENNEAVKNLTKAVARLAENGNTQTLKVKTPHEMIVDALKEKHSQLVEDLKAKRPGFTTLALKAPGTITRPTNITGAEADRLPEPDYIPGFILIPERMPFITDFLSVSPTSSSQVVYTEEKNPEGDFAMTAEGAIKPLLDFEVVPAKSDAKKNAGVIKISEEMLTDLDFMAAEINRRLRKKHDLSLEDNILNGDGTGENFTGITTQAPGFAAGGLALQVTTPNNSDVLRAAINQIIVSSDGEFMPTAIFLNPDDAALMDLEKDVDGAYVLAPFKGADGRQIAGIRVYEKTKIPSGFFLVGDFTLGQHKSYVPFEIRAGWENDDFRRNLITFIGESRTHFYIPSNYLAGFVYDEFSVAKTALEKI